MSDNTFDMSVFGYTVKNLKRKKQKNKKRHFNINYRFRAMDELRNKESNMLSEPGLRIDDEFREQYNSVLSTLKEQVANRDATFITANKVPTRERVQVSTDLIINVKGKPQLQLAVGKSRGVN